MITNAFAKSLFRCSLLNHGSFYANRFVSSSLVLRKFELRDYQQDALAAVRVAISGGIRRPAVVLATGGGKSIVFSHLIPQIEPVDVKYGNKTLVLAHKEELVYQAASTIMKVNPTLKVGIDMRVHHPSNDCDVIVGSVPTLVRMERLEKYNPENFKAIVLDECHHATAPSWLKILSYFDADHHNLRIVVVGFTATMERSDGQSLGHIFDKIVYERNLHDMIKNKELSDARFSTIPVDIDFSKVDTLGDDYYLPALSSLMNTMNLNLYIVLAYWKLKQKYKFRSTLIFCVDIKHCKTLCSIFQRHGVNAQYVTGETVKNERHGIIDDFKNGVIDVLCNVQVFTEGTDIPNIDSLILARPTKSRPLLVQMIGRGLRLHANKTYCHVIDIVGARRTGILSVPNLFSLPDNYKIDGKSFETMQKHKEFCQLQTKLELDEKEKKRRGEELLVNKCFTNLKDAIDIKDLKFKTFDGLMALEKGEILKNPSNKDILSVFARSPLNWTRLEYLAWGVQLNPDSFLLIKKDENKSVSYPIFTLSLNKFASKEMRYASNYKCGNYYSLSVLVNDPILSVALAKAEAFTSSNSSRHLMNFQNDSLISEKQHQYIYTKLISTVRRYYRSFTGIDEKFSTALQGINKKRASYLIFALKYSTLSLWVKWEIQSMLGLNSKSRTTLRRILLSLNKLKGTE